jgi:hypothetical protein
MIKAGRCGTLPPVATPKEIRKMPQVKWFELEICINGGETLVVKERIFANQDIGDRLAHIGINGFAHKRKSEPHGMYYPPSEIARIIYREISK